MYFSFLYTFIFILLQLHEKNHVYGQAQGYPHGGGSCISDYDCSLAGICNQTNFLCQCDAWSTGLQCNLLNLAPVISPNVGLQVPSYYSWGGHALQDETTGLYHGFFSFLCNHATLSEWTTKSSIMRATSTKPEGPYTLAELIVHPWAHNAYIVRDNDGTYALWQIGDANADTSLWYPCFNFSNTSVNQADEIISPNIQESKSTNTSCSGSSCLYLRTAPSLLGPWTTYENNTPISVDLTGSWAETGGTNGGNPAPLVLPNGTILLYYSANPCPPNWGNSVPTNNCIGVARSTTGMKGPYISANPLPVTAPESEDAAVFIDKRGNFHLLTNVNNDHARCAQGVPCGGHAWSKDGITFSNLTIGAFGPIVTFTNNSIWQMAYVERPQVTQAADGTPLTFFVGAGRSSYYDSASYAVPFCVEGQIGCGPMLPPLPIKVQYSDKERPYLCLATNASFPCSGGWNNSCPVFLDNCTLPSTFWYESNGNIESALHPGNCLNIDCNNCQQGTIVKIISCTGTNPVSIVFNPVDSTFPVAECPGLCLDNGLAANKNPPCKEGESWLRYTQVSLEVCDTPITTSWNRNVIS
jgi:hypothetical protein